MNKLLMTSATFLCQIFLILFYLAAIAYMSWWTYEAFKSTKHRFVDEFNRLKLGGNSKSSRIIEGSK
jgi:hypothetical protein